MEYRGYKFEQKGDKVIVEGVKDFHPIHIFECGQCFRWIREEDGSHTGVVKGKVANIKYEEGILTITNTNSDDFKKTWFYYLDLDRDYSLIKKEICKDEMMEAAIKFGHGIRILNQDTWETLISFIISANNRIPMIIKVVAAIAKVYGEEIKYNDKSYYSFPDPYKLASSSVEELEVCKGGFRCKYIVHSSGMIRDGIIDISKLSTMSSDEARIELNKFPGIGNKVADCTLLYSGTKQDVFPTDVWVKRVMEELYFKREASMKEIQEFAKSYFGRFAGFAQQYLFYYAREKKIGTGT
jgi:N-glycosylase/DNA lyase